MISLVIYLWGNKWVPKHFFPFSISILYLHLYFEVKFMCLVKYLTTKSSVRDALSIVYLLVA
jgi:hypothetical protein